MDIMTYQNFEKMLEGPLGKYYEGRWEYFKKVIEILNQHDIKKILELGPALHPIVKDCDIMMKEETDEWGRPETKAPKEYLHDATKIPWPIMDKEYDMFIALQVWEHLGDSKKEAFKEVTRISKMAILSFPYMWDCPMDDRNYPEHHMIDEKIIGRWTLNIKPIEIIKIPRTGQTIIQGPRIIYFWKFD